MAEPDDRHERDIPGVSGLHLLLLGPGSRHAWTRSPPWTAETCTAVPLDDRSLARSGRWTAGTSASYYRSTYLRSYTYGAKLTRTGIVARRIAIVATTCRTCGKVRVYWGSTLLRTVSLYSATTVNRKLITVTTFASDPHRDAHDQGLLERQEGDHRRRRDPSELRADRA